MGKANKYCRCNFCENKREPLYGIACLDNNGESFMCCGWDHFYLDGNKVVEEAKRLGIGVTDVLAMIDAANRLKGKTR